jgi:hypothetical protein
MSQSQSSSRWSGIPRHIGCGVLLIVCLIILAPFLALSSSSFPAADDFCYAQNFVVEDLFSAMWRHYLNWSGRYFSYFLQGVYPLWLGMFESYRFIAPTLLVLGFLAMLFLTSQVFRAPGQWMLKGTIAAALLVTYLLGMPSTATGFYWLAGAITYQTGNILLLVMLAICIKLISGETPPRTTWIVTLGVVIVAGAGSNETSMLAILATIHIAFFLAWRLGRSVRPWLCLLALAYLCFLVVFLSPGNDTRVTAFPHAHDLLYALARASHFGATQLLQWLEQPLFWIYLALLFTGASRLMPACTGSAPLIIIAGLTTLIIPFAGLFPSWWSMGGPAPDRTVNVVYLLFLLSASCATLLLATFPRKNISQISSDIPFGICILTICLCFSVLGLRHPTYVLAVSDLEQRAGPYRETWERRTELFASAQANNELLLPPLLAEPPATIHFDDIRNDPTDWRNACLANYIGVNSVSTPE